MKILEFFTQQNARIASKHRKVQQVNNPAGTKLAKRFRKAPTRGPRGY